MSCESLAALLNQSRVLLLQGPMGPFFATLSDRLVQAGARVWKVHFNGGDEHFYPHRRAIRYSAPESRWEAWLTALVRRRRFDAIVLFGQSRWMHKVAIEIAGREGIRVFVFEEGYFRPDYVTLEVGGVNGRSSLPRDPAWYGSLPKRRAPLPVPTGQRFRRMAWQAIRYYLAAALLRGRYPHQSHHRELHPLLESARWLRGGWRKLRYAWSEREVQARLCSPGLSRKWFLFPLQVHNDAQVTEHSPFGGMPEAIRDVMISFAEHAPPNLGLVLKHHPMDRAYSDHSELIRDLARELDLEGRVHYVHDLHLPTLLKHARGVVTVNSTAGLQSLHHGTPVCVLGDAIYDMAGLTHQLGLESFWTAPAEPDRGLYDRFKAEVVRRCQVNASFYADAPALDSSELSAAEAGSTLLLPARRVTDKLATSPEPLEIPETVEAFQAEMDRALATAGSDAADGIRVSAVSGS